jgi:hypothetical protein
VGEGVGVSLEFGKADVGRRVSERRLTARNGLWTPECFPSCNALYQRCESSRVRQHALVGDILRFLSDNRNTSEARAAFIGTPEVINLFAITSSKLDNPV